MINQSTVNQLFEQFELCAIHADGREFWSARELQSLLGYARWEGFDAPIVKAKAACVGAGFNVDEQFRQVTKLSPVGNNAAYPIVDYELSRYACYLIAQNGDSNKVEIAFAQTYFAVQTRRSELIAQRLLEYERVQAREKLKDTENKLSGILFEHGVDGKGISVIRSKGDQALFNMPTKKLKEKLGIPESKPVADFLPTVTLKAKDLAAEMTSVNVKKKELVGQERIEGEHISNNSAVREILIGREIIPEDLKADEDVNKIARKLKSEDKKALEAKK